MARSAPAPEATRARVWARSTRRDSSLEMVSPASQSSSHTRPPASTTTLPPSIARCARPAAWAQRICSHRSSRTDSGTSAPRESKERAPTTCSVTSSIDSAASAMPSSRGVRTPAREASRVMRAACSAAGRTDMSRVGDRPLTRIRSHRVDRKPATWRSASRTVASRRTPPASHTAYRRCTEVRPSTRAVLCAWDRTLARSTSSACVIVLASGSRAGSDSAGGSASSACASPVTGAASGFSRTCSV